MPLAGRPGSLVAAAQICTTYSYVDRLRSSGLASSSFQLDYIPASLKLHRGQGSVRAAGRASLAYWLGAGLS